MVDDNHLARPAPCFFNTKSGVEASFLNGTKIWRAGGALLCDIGSEGLGECSGVEDSEDEFELELEEELEERVNDNGDDNDDDDDDADSDKHEDRADSLPE